MLKWIKKKLGVYDLLEQLSDVQKELARSFEREVSTAQKNVALEKRITELERIVIPVKSEIERGRDSEYQRRKKWLNGYPDQERKAVV
jgi:hypothetical protein